MGSKAKQGAKAICGHCLQILTAETIVIWKFRIAQFTSQYVTRWGLSDISGAQPPASPLINSNAITWLLLSRQAATCVRLILADPGPGIGTHRAPGQGAKTRWNWSWTTFRIINNLSSRPIYRETWFFSKQKKIRQMFGGMAMTACSGAAPRFWKWGQILRVKRAEKFFDATFWQVGDKILLRYS